MTPKKKKECIRTALARVLSLFAFNPCGITDEKVSLALQMNPSTARPRRIELVKSGIVKWSLGYGRTRSGHKAKIWKHVKFCK